MREAIKVLLVQVGPGLEVRLDALIRRKKGSKIHGQVSCYGQISKRLELQTLANRPHQSAARQAFAAIDHHRARAAHADPARVSYGQVRAGAALQREQRIQEAGFIGHLDLVLLKPLCGFARGAAFYTD